MGMHANGEGTIRQRKNGLWEGRVMVDGKQQSYYGRRHKDVVEAIRQARDAVANNEPPPTRSQNKRTVGQVAEQWLATKKVRNNTLSAHKAYLKNHILPEFAGVQLGALPPGRIDRFLNTRVDAQSGRRSCTTRRRSLAARAGGQARLPTSG